MLNRKESNTANNSSGSAKSNPLHGLTKKLKTQKQKQEQELVAFILSFVDECEGEHWLDNITGVLISGWDDLDTPGDVFYEYITLKEHLRSIDKICQNLKLTNQSLKQLEVANG